MAFCFLVSAHTMLDPKSAAPRLSRIMPSTLLDMPRKPRSFPLPSPDSTSSAAPASLSNP